MKPLSPNPYLEPTISDDQGVAAQPMAEKAEERGHSPEGMQPPLDRVSEGDHAPTLVWQGRQDAAHAGGEAIKPGEALRKTEPWVAPEQAPVHQGVRVWAGVWAWANRTGQSMGLWLKKWRQNKPKAQPLPLKKRLILWTKRVMATAFALGLLAVLAIVIAVHYYGADLPKTKELKNYDPPQVTRILASDGTVLGEMFIERRTVVPIEEIPRMMKLAVLAAEDARFYEHEGLNYLGMLRALLVNLRSGGARQGASTITQQVVKNILLSSERTYKRKVREVLLAHRIEQELTKDQILELYLNHIYFGHGRYGVEEASRFYFGKSVRQVTLSEAAMLAGIVKGPEIYSPKKSPEKAEERRRYVLKQMKDKGFAKALDVKTAMDQPIVVALEADSEAELAPEVIDEVQRVLSSVAGARATRGGYTVTTTIDPAMQAAARTAVRQNLDAYQQRKKLVAPLVRSNNDPPPFQGDPKGGHVYLGVVTQANDAQGTLTVRVGKQDGTIDLKKASRYNPQKLSPSRFAEIGKVIRVMFVGDPAHGKLQLALGPQSALVALDVRTREIVAIIGSYEGVRGSLNRALYAKRQPGSTFKAFVYSYAIHTRRFTAASMVETNPSALVGYKPSNYDESEGQSPNRLREALAHSVNVAAVWTMNQVGPKNVVDWATSMGIQSKLGADLSLALGSYEVTPQEMVGAYAVFAGGGSYQDPILIKRIVGPNGQEIALPTRTIRKVMPDDEAYISVSLLKSVVETGTGKRALVLGRPIGGKTGTSNHVKDAWFVGFSTDITCAVWTGYDDAAPLGAGEAGSTAALPAFVSFMQAAHRNKPATDFPVPPGIVQVAIDPMTGQLPLLDMEGTLQEVFLAGTQPSILPTEPGEWPGTEEPSSEQPSEESASPPTFKFPWPF